MLNLALVDIAYLPVFLQSGRVDQKRTGKPKVLSESFYAKVAYQFSESTPEVVGGEINLFGRFDYPVVFDPEIYWAAFALFGGVIKGKNLHGEDVFTSAIFPRAVFDPAHPDDLICHGLHASIRQDENGFACYSSPRYATEHEAILWRDEEMRRLIGEILKKEED